MYSNIARKSLTRFPLPRFLAYVRASGDLTVSGGPQYSPTYTISCNTVFSKSQNARKDPLYFLIINYNMYLHITELIQSLDFKKKQQPIVMNNYTKKSNYIQSL